MNFEGRLSLMFELNTLEFSSLLCHGFLPSFSRDSYAVHFTVFFFFLKKKHLLLFFITFRLTFDLLFLSKHPYLSNAY